MDKVVLGLSGGVDSAVAARLLLDAGYDVHGLYLDIGLPDGDCFARETANDLGVPLTVASVRDELEANVCAPFAREYLSGRTPNPCIVCNGTVKFPALLRRADKIGAAYIATGHYANARGGALYRGRPENDQSYMLCRLLPAQLRRVLFPLGGFNKTEVRALAAQFGLLAAKRPDSMEICFIPDGDYARFLRERGPVPGEGNFVDDAGNVLGRHKGVCNYTVGQRRGLNIALGERIFVSKIIPERNEIVLARGDRLYASETEAENMNWIMDKRPEEPFEASVRVRHSRAAAPATVYPGEDVARIVFNSPVRAPTPGQSAAIYSGDRLLGSGFISRRSA